MAVSIRAERGDQNCGQIFATYFPIFSGNKLYSFSVFQNLGKITDIKVFGQPLEEKQVSSLFA